MPLRTTQLALVCGLLCFALACGKYGRPERVYSDVPAAAEAHDSEDEAKRKEGAKR